MSERDKKSSGKGNNDKGKEREKNRKKDRGTMSTEEERTLKMKSEEMTTGGKR